MKEIKNKEQRERQKYVPASVKVTNVTMRRSILSASPNGPEQYDTQTW